MSEVASLDLCKELYKLSGWETEDWYDLDPDGKPEEYLATTEDKIDENNYVPAYSAGYLLRKLQDLSPSGEYVGLSADNKPKGSWFACFSTDHSIGDGAYSDTPEDALCKLAIELFKQGILKK